MQCEPSLSLFRLGGGSMKSRGRSPVGSAAHGRSFRDSSHGNSSLGATPVARGSVSGRGSEHGDSLVPPPSAAGGAAGRTPSESGSSVMEPNNGLLEGASPSHQPRPDGASDSFNRTPVPGSSTSSTDNSGLGNSIFYDDHDSVVHNEASLQHTPDPGMTQKAIDQIQNKIEKTKDLIRDEQASKIENVNEYLKLSSNADGQQQVRIKQVFEKKNQKSAQTIAHYGKKLEEYQKKLTDLQEHGIKPKQTHKIGQGLKNVRDGLSGMSSTVMSKPKEFAHLLRHKFGSVDNLSSISKDSDSTEKKENNRSHHGSASLPRENSGGMSGDGQSSFEGGGAQSSNSKRKCISDDGRRSERSESIATSASGMEPVGQSSASAGAVAMATGATSSPHRAAQEHELEHNTSEWKAVMQELTLHKEEVDHLREDMDDLRSHFKQEIEALNYQLREERDRYERLEEQMNDLTELHQHEIENIKSGVNDMEEKVQYQSEERLLDIKEHLQSLETKVTSIEHQQTQQQYLNIEGLDSTDARAVMMKLLTALITVIHIMLFVMGAFMNLARPFLRTTTRAVTTAVILIVAIWAKYQQDSIVGFYHRVRHSVSPTEAEDEL